MPLEAAPILAAAQVNPSPVWVHNGKGFWSGRVEGNNAIIALTGIGLENATQTTQAAFEHFACFSAVVFSGTSGGDYIGDVMVPDRWTEDGIHFVETSASMRSVLSDALSQPVALEQSTPTGDPLCPCLPAGLPGATVPVTVTHKPEVKVGGEGLSNDGFGGRALPCVPQASDVFGCWPCSFPDTAAPTQATNLASTVPPFLEPQFVLGYESASAPPKGTYVSDDMETAAVFSIVASHGVPFIGFRAASDGGGDPLMLPGFPAEFFLYRQLAADNAAAVALAFLRAWHAAHS
jgi:nucleoside phosphorylase